MFFKEVENKLVNFFGFLQKKSGLDVKYYAKGSAINLFGYVFDVLGGLAVSFIFARYVPREIYGQWKLLLSFVVIANIFGLFSGMSTALLRSAAIGQDGAYKAIIKRVFISGLRASVALLVISYAYSYISKQSFDFRAIYLLALFIPLQSCFSYYSTFLYAQRRYLLLQKYNIVYRVFYTLAAIGVLLIDRSLLLVVIGTLLSDVLLKIILTLRSFKYIKNDDGAEDAIKYGASLSRIKILQVVADQLDSILLGYLLGYQAIAIYAVAVIFPGQIRNLINKITDLSLSKMANWEQTEKNRSFIMRYSIYLFILIFLSVGVYFFAAPMLFKIFLPKYPDALVYSQVYSLTILNISTLLLWNWMQVHKKKKAISFNYTFSAILQIVLDVVLIPFYGIWGLVVARVMNGVLSVIFLVFTFLKVDE